jgi:NTE family protein
MGVADADQGGRRPALVLGGGGAYGVVQAAYIQAVYEAGFRPSMVIGTSVGSLNGAWVAMYPDDPENLLKIWTGMDRIRLLRLNPMRVAGRVVRRPLSLSTNEIVPQLIEQHVGDLTFADTKLPLAVVATNLLRGQKHVFHTGPLGQAILASTAIPGLFDPVELDGELFIDGGIIASLDLATALAMGATEILAIDLTPMPSGVRPRTALGVMRQSLGILAHSGTDAMEACVAQLRPVQVVRPDLTAHSPWRVEDCASAMERSLELARAAMPTVIDREGKLIPKVPELIFQPASPAVMPPARARTPFAGGFSRFLPMRAKRQAT